MVHKLQVTGGRACLRGSKRYHDRNRHLLETLFTGTGKLLVSHQRARPVGVIDPDRGQGDEHRLSILDLDVPGLVEAASFDVGRRGRVGVSTRAGRLMLGGECQLAINVDDPAGPFIEGCLARGFGPFMISPTGQPIFPPTDSPNDDSRLHLAP